MWGRIERAVLKSIAMFSSPLFGVFVVAAPLRRGSEEFIQKVFKVVIECLECISNQSSSSPRCRWHLDHSLVAQLYVQLH